MIRLLIFAVISENHRENDIEKHKSKARAMAARDSTHVPILHLTGTFLLLLRLLLACDNCPGSLVKELDCSGPRAAS